MDQPGHSEQKPSTSVSSAFEGTRRDFSSDSDSESVVSDRPPVDIYVEEGELSDEQDFQQPQKSYSFSWTLTPAFARLWPNPWNI